MTEENKQEAPVDISKLSYEEFRPILDRFAADVVNRITALETNGVPGLRDFFATSALSLLAQDGVLFGKGDYEQLANKAFKMADAMLTERDKKLNAEAS